MELSNVIEFGDFREIGRKWATDGVKIQTCVTSPPYFGLRDYGVSGQIGLEETPEKYVAEMVATFGIVRDLLADDGTLWLNLGDSYAGSWGNQGRKETRGSQRPVNGEMLQKVHDGRYPSPASKTGSLGRTPGLKNKDLIGIPWRVAFALQADGWYLRQDIIWMKRNPMPESVRDRCTKSHEYLFLLSKSPKYYFDSDSIREPSVTTDVRRPYTSQGAWELDGRSEEQRHGGKPRGGKSAFRGQGHFRDGAGPANRDGREMKEVGAGLTRNKRSVWDVTTKPFKGAHFATFPPDLIEPCILAGSRPGDIVLDPFMGSGTTAGVAVKHGRRYLGCELNPEYGKLHDSRIQQIVNGKKR